MKTDIFNKKIHKWKTNLIDLSKRNRLMNFKDNVASVIKFKTDLNMMYQSLSSDKSLTVQSIVDLQKFIDKEKRARAKKAAVAEVEDSEFDDIVIFAYEKLENALQSIRLKAKSSLDEKGVNTLYVTFGQLVWKESRDSNFEMKSPLLLFPVTLKRESSDRPYFLERFDDDLTLNPTLVHKIKSDFGIVLPPIDNEEEINIIEYLNTVKEVIKANKDWSVTADAHLGLFSYSKLVMYKDFEQFTSEISNHPIVQKLAGVLKENDHDEYIEADQIEHHDRISKSVESFQILDADSSQQEAILAANNGRSFIISGPPGTGKSQTISNIIAESLAKGKKVLFVSEKKAALEVVKKRLDDKHLGDFCLELHSNTTNKKTVLAELDRTLSQKLSHKSGQNTFEQFDKIKIHLNSYTEALHKLVPPLQLTAFQAHGELSRLADVLELTFAINEVGYITDSNLNEIHDLLGRLRQYAYVLRDSETHIWSGSQVKKFTLELQSDITVKFKRLSSVFKSIDEELYGLIERLGLDWNANPNNLINLQLLNNLLKEIPIVPEDWLSKDGKLTYRSAVCNEAIETFDIFHSAKLNITSAYNEEVWRLDSDQVTSDLASTRDEINMLLDESYLNELVMGSQSTLNDFNSLNVALEDLAETNNDLSQILGFNVDAFNLERMSIFNSILEKVAIRIRPTAHWFEVDSFNKVKEALLETRAIIEEYHSDINSFNQIYERQLLDRMELNGMLDRFMLNYSSVFRFIKNSYRNDQKILNFHLKSPAKRKFNDLLQDVKLIDRVLKKKKWIESEHLRIVSLLGDNYRGLDTNWTELEANIAHMENLNNCLVGNRIPDEKIKLLLLQATMSEMEQVTTLHNKINRSMSVITEASANTNRLLSKNVGDEIDKTPILELRIVIGKIIALSNSFNNAKLALLSYSTKTIFNNYEEMVDDLQSISKYKESKRVIEENKPLFKSVFGDLFTDYDTDWDNVLKSLEWTTRLREVVVDTLPEELVQAIQTRNKLLYEFSNQRLETVSKRIYDSLTLLQFFQSIFPAEAAIFGGKTLKEVDYKNCTEMLENWANESYKLEEWTAVQQILSDANTLGIQEFIQEVKGMEVNEHTDFSAVFLKRFYKLWLDYAYDLLPALQRFNADQHGKLIAQFKTLDKSQLESNGSRVHAILNNIKKARISSSDLTYKVGVLKREISKKTKHKPIRKLFAEIPEVIFALKPCLMMSPMSVSQFIDPSNISFDTVIFDEASQLCTEDAIGAIFRGEQIIIAGDKKQLPPSKFFGTTIEEDEEFVDEDDESNDSYESVLEEASIFMRVKPLLWHYRSKHESLIAFSNNEIYDKELYTFPSSSNVKDDGVSMVYVPDGVYERSTSRRNLNEAKTVAQLVFDHIRRSPERSLGVIAFSEAQQQAILDQIHALRKQYKDSQFESFFDDSKSDYFFVKNLENVQGDERDTIFFSVGYGKDSNGNIHYNFGPLNKPGGERRLNVAVTRAKHEIKLVSSILHSDLDDAKLNKRGPQLLKAYLFYAHTGGKFSSNLGIQHDGEFDSPLEEDVYGALTARGLMLRKQVGCSSYRIDLAVVDPEKPGNYILGIECDGAAYHSSKTARDRDRLRQEILESLGWRIHRIWSQDWFRRKKDEIDKIMSIIKNDARGEL
ncbi:DUF4011 domain-containing protein [Paenibacillus odorifer]|uniref:RAP domain-containing protein n=1 Tax=Paenibacillus odorifer TaxID=189426 RepID=A0A1R0Y1E8_9BACL|nr:DUF4011 domain-containing protein [Paenibacillus odorifer]OMD41126.1 hypothetical protein BSK52_11895 [Paenibacillus odorifer]